MVEMVVRTDSIAAALAEDFAMARNGGDPGQVIRDFFRGSETDTDSLVNEIWDRIRDMTPDDYGTEEVVAEEAIWLTLRDHFGGEMRVTVTAQDITAPLRSLPDDLSRVTALDFGGAYLYYDDNGNWSGDDDEHWTIESVLAWQGRDAVLNWRDGSDRWWRCP